jgi:hypothetical protein
MTLINTSQLQMAQMAAAAIAVVMSPTGAFGGGSVVIPRRALSQLRKRARQHKSAYPTLVSPSSGFACRSR